MAIVVAIRVNSYGGCCRLLFTVASRCNATSALARVPVFSGDSCRRLCFEEVVVVGYDVCCFEFSCSALDWVAWLLPEFVSSLVVATSIFVHSLPVGFSLLSTLVAMQTNDAFSRSLTGGSNPKLALRCFFVFGVSCCCRSRR